MPALVHSNNAAKEEEGEATSIDLEQLARDYIARLVIAKFKGKKMERLVAAILKAQGYFTFESPKVLTRELIFSLVPELWDSIACVYVCR